MRSKNRSWKILIHTRETLKSKHTKNDLKKRPAWVSILGGIGKLNSRDSEQALRGSAESLG